MESSMIIFHTDLDNTLIYSYKHDIGEDKRCTEVYQGREISFITQETYRLLKEVQKEVVIVPTTTRTIEQYRRIDLGIGDFRYALACNGGVLLVDGKEEENWYQKSLELVSDSEQELSRAVAFLQQDKRRCFELRFIRKLFVFTKCEEPESVVEELKSVLDAGVVDVFHNGAKLYVVPKTLSKGNAVDRFRSYIRDNVNVGKDRKQQEHAVKNCTGIDCVIAAGDSEFDISMLEAADYGIAAPELVRKHDFSVHVKCPPADRLYAEAVLESVLQICRSRH